MTNDQGLIIKPALIPKEPRRGPDVEGANFHKEGDCGPCRKRGVEFSVFDSQFSIFFVHVALYEPEIPPNTGNIARLCAATFTDLHIVGVTGFRMDDRTLRRSGLDYWDEVKLHRHIDIDALWLTLPGSRFIYLTTKAKRRYSDWDYRPDDCLVFGPETRGLPEDLLRA